MKRILVNILTVLLLVVLNVTPLYAASGSTKCTVSTLEPTEGSKITLKIYLTCSSGIGGGKVVLNYDSDYFSNLTLSSSCKDMASLNATNKTILIEPKQVTSETIVLTLTAKKTGKTDIVFNISGFIDYNSGSAVSGYTKSFTKNMNVKEKATPTPVLSTDANLSSLSIEGLDFLEKFNKEDYEYTAYAPMETTSLKVNAVANSSKATISAINSTVKQGWNDIEVVCIAESGKKQTYLIHVYVEEQPTISYQDGKYGIVKNIDLVQQPEGFEPEIIKINEEEVTIFKQGNMALIYLVNENSEKAFYIYHQQEDLIVGLYQPIILNQNIYLSSDLVYEDYADMNEDYEPATYTVQSIEVKGWKYKAENMSDYQLYYLTNLDGEKQIYSYDTKEETLQRFTLPYIEPVEQPKDYKELICYGMAGFGTVSLLCSLLMLIKVKRIRKSYR